MSVLLLVEGKSDIDVLAQLIRISGIGTSGVFPRQQTADFILKELGSYGELRRDLGNELVTTAFSRFGIIPDADTNVASRWKSLTSRLLEIVERSSQLFDTLPQAPDPDRTILHTNTGRVIGIWLWPNDISTGDTEAFAGKLTPQ